LKREKKKKKEKTCGLCHDGDGDASGYFSVGAEKTICCAWLLVMAIHREMEEKKRATKEKNRSLQIPEPSSPRLHPTPQVTSITRKSKITRGGKTEKESEKRCFYKRVSPEITQTSKRKNFKISQWERNQSGNTKTIRGRKVIKMI